MSNPEKLEELFCDTMDALEKSMHRFPVERTGEREPIPYVVRLCILKRDGFRCDWCGRNGPGQAFHLDHIKPWSAGGADDSTNLRLLCPSCNESRSNFQTDAPYTRRLACAPMCMPCMGWTEVDREDFDPDERQQVFCGTCSRPSWAALGWQWGCEVV